MKIDNVILIIFSILIMDNNGKIELIKLYYSYCNDKFFSLCINEFYFSLRLIILIEILILENIFSFIKLKFLMFN